VIGGERAVKEELAIVEGRVIEVVAVRSPAVAGPAEAAAEAGPAPLKASIAVVARHAAPASAVVPAGQALAGVEVPEAEAAVHEAGEAAEDDEDRSVRFSAISFRSEKWNTGKMEHRRNVISAVQCCVVFSLAMMPALIRDGGRDGIFEVDK